MKSLIIYYSYSGNTKKVAEILGEFSRERNETELIELKGMDESHNFFIQALRAFRHKKTQIQPVNFNLTNFDRVCFGTPVWAFGPAPEMNTYLDKCEGIADKEVVLFATYGSGAGKEHCLDYMQEVLRKKGAKGFKRFSIQQFQVKDKGFVLERIKEVLL